MASKGTIIVTGASQGIGARVVQAFLERGYNVVANSRNITSSGTFRVSDKLALVAGNIGETAVAANVVETAITRFPSTRWLTTPPSSLARPSRSLRRKTSRRFRV